MDRLINLFQTMGPFALIPILFVVAGVGSWLNILWGLVTGGPRALQETGAPYLYDRPYYLMWLAAIAGWTVALLSVLAETGGEPKFEGFLLGWSLLALGMGLIFRFRLDMTLRAARYLSQHGFWLFRLFHMMQARQFGRRNARQAVVLKLLPLVFLFAGAGLLLFSLLNLPEAWRQIVTGAKVLAGFLTDP